MDFLNLLKEKNILLTDYQIHQFERYYQLLVEWNEKMNLTAITDRDDVYFKHFYDSLTISFDFPFSSQSLIDIGAGAGFPSIPLKIIYPDLKITIVDSLGKRIQFLKMLIKELELNHVEAIHTRAEDYVKLYRESFDLATARAVARLNILDELCLPFVKEDGYFLVLKGKAGEEELKEAKKGIKILGGQIIKDVSFALSKDQDYRHNIIIHKIRKTPSQYPRLFGKIKKQPL